MKIKKDEFISGLCDLALKEGGSHYIDKFDAIIITFPSSYNNLSFEFWQSPPSPQGPGGLCVSIMDTCKQEYIYTFDQLIGLGYDSITELIVFNIDCADKYSVIGYGFEF